MSRDLFLFFLCVSKNSKSILESDRKYLYLETKGSSKPK